MPDVAGPGSPGPGGRSRHAAPDGARAAPVLPGTGGRARHRDRSGRPGARGVLLALALAVLAVAAVLVPRLVEARTADGAAGSTASPTTTGPSATATTAPADWLAAALPPSTDLAASAAVGRELTAQGFPADRLRPDRDGAASGDLLAVVGPAPPGSRPVAHFDRPGGDGELLVVDPRPGEPTTGQLAQRRSLGAALLANPATGADPAVRAALESGEVDPRLLGLLAVLAAHEGVGVAAFPVLPGEEGSPTPARRVLLDAVGGAPVPGDAAATDRLRAWLAAQLPPFAPGEVRTTGEGVLVCFPYVSDPDALVAEATR